MRVWLLIYERVVAFSVALLVRLFSFYFIIRDWVYLSPTILLVKNTQKPIDRIQVI